MSTNKLNLVVQFTGIDKLSGGLKNIIGVSRQGKSALGKLHDQSKALKKGLADVSKEIEGATGNISHLINRERSLAAEMEKVNHQIGRHKRLNEITGQVAAARQRGGDIASSGASNLTAGAIAAAPIVMQARAAMAFESAMADVRKVVDFDTPRQFEKMSQDVLDLSTRVPMAADGIAAIVAAAGRANIARSELLVFAQDAAKLGIAFDVSADESGQMMAKWRTAFSMSQPQVVALSDQINALTNRYGGNADAVAGIVTRIGSLGKVAGVAAPQVAAMAQLLNSVGVEEEVAATGIKNMMLGLVKGTAATKGQKAALASLGLESTLLAKRMQTDASGTITDVLGRISRLPQEAQAGLLTELFGSESISAIAPLLTNLDKLQGNLGLVGDQAQYAGSMNKEFLARIATTEGATGLAANAFKAVNIELGNQLLPTITEAAKVAVTFLQGMRAWINENPAAARTIMMLVSASIGLKLGLGLLQIAFGGLVGSMATVWGLWTKYRTAGTMVAAFPRLVMMFRLLQGATVMLSQGLLRLGAAFVATVGWPLIIAAAIAAVAYLVYANWDKIKAAFAEGWQWVKAKLANAPTWLTNIGRMMMEGLLMSINPAALALKLVSVARNGITAFKNYLGIKSPSRLMMEMGGHVATGLGIGLDQQRGTPVRAMGRMAGAVAGAGAMALSPASARPTAATAPQAIPKVEIHVHQQPGEDANALAERVARQVEQAQRGKALRSFGDD